MNNIAQFVEIVHSTDDSLRLIDEILEMGLDEEEPKGDEAVEEEPTPEPEEVTDTEEIILEMTSEAVEDTEEPESGEVAESIACPNCGTELPSDADTCFMCDVKIDKGGVAPTEAEAPQEDLCRRGRLSYCGHQDSG